MCMLGFNYVVLTLFPRLSTQDVHAWIQFCCPLFPRLLTPDVHAWFQFCCSHCFQGYRLRTGMFDFNPNVLCFESFDSRCVCLVSILLFSLCFQGCQLGMCMLGFILIVLTWFPMLGPRMCMLCFNLSVLTWFPWF